MFKSRIHKCQSKKMKTSQVIVYNEDIESKFKQVKEIEKDNGVFNRKTESVIFHHLKTSIQKIEKNFFEIYLISVHIEGEEYKFIIDTGAQISAIMDNVELQCAKATNQEIQIGSVSGKRKSVNVVCLPSFFFASIEIQNAKFALLSKEDFKMPVFNKDIVEFDGILGWDILSKFDFEIDDKACTFSVVEEKGCYAYRNLMDASFPICIVYDDLHKSKMFGIDTGAHESWLLELEDDKTRRKGKSFGVGVHGIETLSFQIVDRLDLYLLDEHLILTNTRTGNTQICVGLKLDGIFGNEIFKGKKIQFLNSKGIVRMVE